MTSALDPYPRGDSPPRLTTVGAEMAQVFAAAGAGSEVAVEAGRRSSAVAALRPGRTGGRPGVVAVIAAVAGLAGLGAGVVAFRSPSPSPSAVAPGLAAPRAASAPTVSVAASAPLDVGPALAHAPALSPAPPPGPSPVVEKPAKARSAQALEGGARASLPRVETAQTGAGSGCARAPWTGACRTAVVRADQRLREAYGRAARSGVPNEVLVDYRERWTDLRERDSGRPARLIQEYGVLAAELGREARSEHPRRRRASPLRELKTAFLSWW